MNEHEATDVIARLADTVPDSAAPLADLLEQGEQTKRRRRMALTLGAAATAAVTIVAAAVFAGIARDTNSDGPTPAVTQPSDTAWEELTGKAAGEALGLTPMTGDEAHDCTGHYFMEFIEGVGFCYTPADLGFTPLDDELFRLQVMFHYQRDENLVEYARIQLRILEGTGGAEQWRELAERMNDLRPLLVTVPEPSESDE